MLNPIYPDTDMPVVQLSICDNYDPQTHMAIGRALAPLRDEGMLMIGSGLSYHNLRAFGPQRRAASHRFDAWLQHTMLNLTPDQRQQALFHWSAAPSARVAHPREDHLVPLMVAAGAAKHEAAASVYHEDDFFGSLTMSSFRFDAAAA